MHVRAALLFLAMLIGLPLQAADFDTTLAEAQAKVETQIEQPFVIPTPKDAGGGYTHEKHKENAKLIYQAAMLYKLTSDKKYAHFSARLMEAYAGLYPAWGTHPAPKEQSPGRMFWQNLNESWWLVHVAQAYGAIKPTLSDKQQHHIETNLLRNMADFLSEGSPQTFNKIHNHGTWANAAVGITGYAIGDKDYTQKALLGLDKSGQAGFLKQLDTLFSPDGYYNEGPYYQRYALMPFVLFGQAIDANEPARKIFEYRDGILSKAIYTTIDLSYNGLFFPINDAMKDKGIATTELLYGVAIAYDLTQDPTLLSIAQAQNAFVLTEESRAVSDAIKAGHAKPYPFRSRRFSDGADGLQGALDILRHSFEPDGLTLIIKNTSQGLGHGHFDKLGLLLYDQGKEVLRDYGAARFLNVEAKYGGHYLPENNSYAKQTIAHNTLVIDETSHFEGSTKQGNKYAPQPGIFVDMPALKIASAQIDKAYEGVAMHRTVAMISDPAFQNPIIIDLIETKSNKTHQYDLPFHYNGHLVETNFPLTAHQTELKPLSKKNGYQHLWKLAQVRLPSNLSQVTFLLANRFYTISSHVPRHSEIIFAKTGANDPSFNLRHEPVFILRSQGERNISFISVIEPHGEYNPTEEFTQNSHSEIKNISYHQDSNEKLIRIETKSGKIINLALSEDQTPTHKHSIAIGENQVIEWTGPYHLFPSSQLTSKGEE